MGVGGLDWVISRLPGNPEPRSRIATCNFGSMAESLGDLSKLLMSRLCPQKLWCH